MTSHAVSPRPRALAAQLRTTLLLSCAALALAAAPVAAHAAAEPPHVIYTFSGQGPDGYDPAGSMILDSAGDLFGVTVAGGSTNNGLVFELTRPKGPSHTRTLKPLYSFQGGDDGSVPNDSLVMDAAGDLIGVTIYGGPAKDGTIFMLVPSSTDPSGYTKKTLYSFSGTDGANPHYGLTVDKAGNYYGTTSYGGSANIGTIFKLSPPAGSATSWTLTKLHDLTGSDNAGVPNGLLTLDAAGNLYGTTYNGTGTVYEFTPGKKAGGTFSVIYTFQGLNDGQTPEDGLAFTAAGDLVGTAVFGGVDSYGTVYQLSKVGKKWHEKTLAFFNGHSCGMPSGKLLLAANGHLFGVASQPSCVYEVTPRASGSGYQIDTLYGLSAYSSATGALVSDTKGNLFGADGAGGNSAGELFELPAAAKH